MPVSSRFLRNTPSIRPTVGKFCTPLKCPGLQLLEEAAHHAERVGAADAGQHRRVLDDRQHFGAHLDHDLVRVAVRKQARQRPASRHAETAGIVDDEDVGPAGLGRLRRDAGTGTHAQQDVALGKGLPETVEDFRT